MKNTQILESINREIHALAEQDIYIYMEGQDEEFALINVYYDNEKDLFLYQCDFIGNPVKKTLPQFCFGPFNHKLRMLKERNIVIQDEEDTDYFLDEIIVTPNEIQATYDSIDFPRHIRTSKIA